MADNRAFFKVDVGYFMNPKVATVLAESPTAVLLHLEATAYCAQHLTDGVAPLALIMRVVGATQDDAERLFKRGLLIDRHDGDVEVHDYLEHQRSAAEAKKLSEAGKKGAAGRWNKTGSDSPSDANGNADRMRTPMAREREEREIDSAPRRRSKRRLPSDWRPNDKHREQAAAKGLDVTSEAARLRNWAEANDARYADWDSMFRNWLDRARPTEAPARPSNWDRLPTAAELRARREAGEA